MNFLPSWGFAVYMTIYHILLKFNTVYYINFSISINQSLFIKLSIVTNLDFDSIILGSNILVYRARKSMKTHFQELLALLFQQSNYHHDSCSLP